MDVVEGDDREVWGGEIGCWIGGETRGKAG